MLRLPAQRVLVEINGDSIRGMHRATVVYSRAGNVGADALLARPPQFDSGADSWESSFGERLRSSSPRVTKSVNVDVVWTRRCEIRARTGIILDRRARKYLPLDTTPRYYHWKRLVARR